MQNQPKDYIEEFVCWLNWNSPTTPQGISFVQRHVKMRVTCPDQYRRKKKNMLWKKACDEPLIGLIHLEECNIPSQIQLICLKSGALINLIYLQ